MFNNTKRTRSQLALPDFNFELLSRSPLKDARIALRTNINTASVEDHLDMEGELEVDAIPTRQAKRPFSPLKDPLAPRERVLKKPKWDTSDVENETASHILKSFPKKPSSTSSEPSPKSTFTAPSHRRAKSVPVERYTPIRHLDLKRLSPSPWRSPSKSKQKLKIATFPSMETIQDNMLAESSKPSASQVAETAASAELSDGGPSRTPPVHEDVNMSSPPLSPPPTSPSELISPPHSQLRSTPPSLSELSFSRPPSPLTPLPPTPRPTKIPSYPTGNVSRQTVLSGDGESLYPPSQPKTPFSASRLPKLSFAVSSRPSASNTSKTKIKTTLQSKPRTRTNKPKPVIALGGRVTRSSSLRQKEASAVEEIPTSAPTAGTTGRSKATSTICH